MRHKFLLISFVMLSLLWTACEETEEVSRYDNWQEKNEAFMDSLLIAFSSPDHGGMDTIHMLTAPNDILFFKHLPPVVTLPGYKRDADRRPFYTESVKAYYKLVNILGERWDGFYGDAPTVTDTPAEFALTNVITGWTEMLQRMTVGERRLIYVPWKYGYGSSGYGNVLGYSTLIFDIQLHSVIE